MEKIQGDYMLSTYDNPFNPFDDFETWWKYDHLLGHDCCEYLARESATSSVFSDELNESLIDEAAERIVKRERMIYRIVFRDDFKNSNKNKKVLQTA